MREAQNFICPLKELLEGGKIPKKNISLFSKNKGLFVLKNNIRNKI